MYDVEHDDENVGMRGLRTAVDDVPSHEVPAPLGGRGQLEARKIQAIARPSLNNALAPWRTTDAHPLAELSGEDRFFAALVFRHVRADTCDTVDHSGPLEHASPKLHLRDLPSTNSSLVPDPEPPPFLEFGWTQPLQQSLQTLLAELAHRHVQALAAGEEHHECHEDTKHALRTDRLRLCAAVHALAGDRKS